ncbi:hypothetical protein [Tengunoibacter tsumagoiensis]|uniref:Uncharacterized protein n=1 Tax=Tengunoibacter tsumagoiensis TaxID=2014871 RepID=A0A401ZZW1_9CHLR|nr:hypothetical protein [Tengunoibacter tsumagoiensis]GCE12332.1 hypothetical protein KTT_21910 [Tengunoibacter tsumagoiensis]
MEPLDSNYVVQRHENPRARFNWLYIIPVLASLWLLYLVAAAIFQFPITGIIDPVMSLMIVGFFVMVGLLFWALAPRSNR